MYRMCRTTKAYESLICVNFRILLECVSVLFDWNARYSGSPVFYYFNLIKRTGGS